MNCVGYWLHLAAEPSAVGWGRRYVTRALREAGVAHVVDDAELIASELLTNAVRATGTDNPTPGWVARGKLPLVAVRVVVQSATVRVEVWDTSRRRPTIRDADADAENGRGLPIVQKLSQRGGVWLPDTGGKVVYAELSTMPPPVAAPVAEPVAVPAPRPQPPVQRVRARSPRPWRVAADAGVIDQIMARLTAMPV